MNSICSNGSRIAKCMKEYFTYKKNYGGTLNSTLLAKSLYQKLWDDSPYLLKQLPGIGMVTAKVCSLTSWAFFIFFVSRTLDLCKLVTLKCSY